MASLGMTILMVSFTTLLVGYSVSPMRFTKSNFREVQMQTVSNFRRALAISLAEVSQQLEFKARVRQYSMYLDLDTYPQARNLGYDLLSRWQNLTMLSYPGTGLNLTASIPAFSCSWNSTSGISTANANMMLDILNYGFFGFKESSVASLNLTLLDLSQIGSVTSFFFSLKAENDRPVPDLSDSSIHILYQKTNGGWNSSDPASTKVYYLGQGVYQARFNVNASQMYIPPHVRLIVQDSRGIIVGARSVLSQSSDTTGPIASNIVATPNPSSSAPSVTLRATISDLLTGWSEVQSAECLVKNSSGATIVQTSMIAADGAFNAIIEPVITNSNVTGWPLGNYTVYVRGQDNKGNWGAFNSTLLRITSAPKMHVENIDMSFERRGQSGWVRAMAVVTILDERSLPVEGATVRAHWSGGATDNVFGNTNSQGKVTLITSWRRYSRWEHVTFTITIDNVERSGYIYDPAANKESTDSITT
jgi:hypothetical protein